MSVLTPTDVRAFLKDYFANRQKTNGGSPIDDLPEDCDLLLSGMIDSIGLLDLVAALQEFARCDIDFEVLDPEQMTVVGPLSRFVSEQANRHR